MPSSNHDSGTESEKHLLTLPSLTATTALKRKQVGVVAVAAQAKIRPPDGVSLTRVKNELGLGKLHDPRTELVALIVHIGDLGQREEIYYMGKKCRLLQYTVKCISGNMQVITSPKIQINVFNLK